MNPTRRTLLLALTTAPLAAWLGGCGSGNDDPAPLSAAEADDLTYVRQEEKLARDVYLALGGHGQPFVNIATSEQTHMDRVGELLTRYGLTDPVAGLDRGAFARTDLKELHDQLVAAGNAGHVGALSVGLEIEELDLHDIDARSARASRDDVRNVFAQLERGSRNHLRAFWSALQAAGGTYTPKHLSADEFFAIATSPQEPGG